MTVDSWDDSSGSHCDCDSAADYFTPAIRSQGQFPSSVCMKPVLMKMTREPLGRTSHMKTRIWCTAHCVTAWEAERVCMMDDLWLWIVSPFICNVERLGRVSTSDFDDNSRFGPERENSCVKIPPLIVITVLISTSLLDFHATFTSCRKHIWTIWGHALGLGNPTCTKTCAQHVRGSILFSTINGRIIES